MCINKKNLLLLLVVGSVSVLHAALPLVQEEVGVQELKVKKEIKAEDRGTFGTQRVLAKKEAGVKESQRQFRLLCSIDDAFEVRVKSMEVLFADMAAKGAVSLMFGEMSEQNISLGSQYELIGKRENKGHRLEVMNIEELWEKKEKLLRANAGRGLWISDLKHDLTNTAPGHAKIIELIEEAFSGEKGILALALLGDFYERGKGDQTIIDLWEKGTLSDIQNYRFPGGRRLSDIVDECSAYAKNFVFVPRVTALGRLVSWVEGLHLMDFFKLDEVVSAPLYQQCERILAIISYQERSKDVFEALRETVKARVLSAPCSMHKVARLTAATLLVQQTELALKVNDKTITVEGGFGSSEFYRGQPYSGLYQTIQDIGGVMVQRQKYDFIARDVLQILITEFLAS